MDMRRDELVKSYAKIGGGAMIVKLGSAYINLCLVPIVEFDRDDENRERVIFWLHQGPVAYVKGEEVPEEEFAKLKEALEVLKKGVALC
jgi:hypothetical protein